MQKYVPVQWFLDTTTMLKRSHPSYTEEFHILNPEVPVVNAVPAEDVEVILKSLEIMGGHSELIEYIKALLREGV